MSSGKTNRNRGFGYEREIVKDFRSGGFEADRAWGSDGRSRGLPEDVDIIVKIEGGTHALFQAKRKKQIAAFLKPEAHHMGVILREDRGESLVVIRLDLLIRLLGIANGTQPDAQTNERITIEWDSIGSP